MSSTTLKKQYDEKIVPALTKYLYNRTVLGGLNRQDAALAALVLTSENVNGISLFDIYFAHWGFQCLF